MRSVVLIQLPVLFVCGLYMVACSGEPRPAKSTSVSGQLQGFWLLDSATRDGNPTSTLSGLFLDIRPDEITSNFGGDTLTSGYAYDESRKQIRHFIRDTFLYEIAHMNDSFLKINSTIRDYPFEFDFKRVQKDSL